MVNEMKIWINRCQEEEKSTNYTDAFTFNIDVPGQKGKLTSDIREGWYRVLGVKMLEPLYEDLFLLSLVVFGVDKRIWRRAFPDCWTRTLYLNFPVIEYEKWCSVKSKLEKLLSFLSGDIWYIDFRESSAPRYQSTRKRTPKRSEHLDKITAVSLFSGGLDSLCGAYELMEKKESTMFVSFKEYGKLPCIQKEMQECIKESYPEVTNELFLFTAKPYQPTGDSKIKAENTSRSRSFLFLCTAICVAEVIGPNVPVYIPENGFIGLNLPLSAGRVGSCSTRTTHPFFLSSLKDILQDLKISHEVINPYAFMTKNQMVDRCINYSGFPEQISKTISCSHPCNTRWRGNPNPENCGYCYPCLIRKASLIEYQVLGDHYTEEMLTSDYIEKTTSARRSDLVDLCSAIYKVQNESSSELLRRINRTGRLTNEEAELFAKVYTDTMVYLVKMLSADPELLRKMGIKHEIN